MHNQSWILTFIVKEQSSNRELYSHQNLSSEKNLLWNCFWFNELRKNVLGRCVLFKQWKTYSNFQHSDLFSVCNNNNFSVSKPPKSIFRKRTRALLYLKICFRRFKIRPETHLRGPISHGSTSSTNKISYTVYK